MTTYNTAFPHPKYRPDIDGLRAVAVLSVVVFHAFPSWLKGGFVGVDVFFVISGYLISTILFQGLDEGRIGFAGFYARRIRRIFPAVLLVGAASYVFGWFALLSDEYRQLGKHLAAGAGFVSNFVLRAEAGYFDSAAESKPLLHLWSLGVEEQFYILWPLVLWLAWRARFNLITLSVVAALVSFYLNLKEVKADSASAFYLPQYRFWELLLGSVLAALSMYARGTFGALAQTLDRWLAKMVYRDGVQTEGATLANALSLVGSLLLAYSFLRFSRELSFPGKWAFVPAAGAVLIILAGPGAWINRNILSSRIAVWFGLISFPLYLWHWPLLSFARVIESEVPSREVRLALVLASVVLAWMTYQFVERPIRFGGRGGLKVALLCVLMVLLGGAGYLTYANQGLPSRAALLNVSPPIEGLVEDEKKAHDACLKAYGLDNAYMRYCRLSATGGLKPRVALIGDSHAAALFHGLSAALKRDNRGLVMMGGRLFINVAAYPEGDEFEINVYQGGILATRFVAQERSIETVVMVSRGPGYIKEGGNFYLLGRKEISDRAKVFEIGMRETLDLMIANNKKIIFVIDNPELSFDPKKCQDSRPFRVGRNFPCAIDRTAFDERHGDYRKMVLRVLESYPSVVVFDQAAYLCGSEVCSFKRGSAVLYSDANHLSVRGSEFMADQLIKVIDGSASRMLK